MIIFFFSDQGFQLHMQGHRFMCDDCKLNEQTMKTVMSANEEEVHILSVVTAGPSNERNLKP